MNSYRITLVDHQEREHLLPLTFTRPVANIRVGALTIAEKWQKRFGASIDFLVPAYLQPVFPRSLTASEFAVNGAVIPTAALVKEILSLEKGQSVYMGEQWIASRTHDFSLESIPQQDKLELQSELNCIDRVWKIFQLNDWALREDFEWLRASMSEKKEVPDFVQRVGDDIFIAEDAELSPCILNASTGPIYIGPKAVVMDGALVRGPLALMDHSQLKMGAKIYGATTIGPHSKVGGEVNNAVIFGYSNKGHDGFIGNSVIGEWCNLGADTNTSNLKNNYAPVKIYNYALNRSESTGGQFCGLTMGDHAKAGINTMFNTGTVCGVFANVFGAGFPHRHIPDFGWGGADGFKKFRIADALQVAERVMERRGIALSDEWIKVYTHLYDQLSERFT